MAACPRCARDNPPGFRFCGNCGAELVQDGGGQDERKVATVLFADLAGSTSAASGQDPERTRSRLDRFYTAMTEIIEAEGGTVEKFAGDAVMAAFGAPAAQEDHAQRALRAALGMTARLDEVFGGELQLRVGVNTGEVVVGQARAGSSFVSGDAVNVAARLEQAAAPGQVLVGERTALAAPGFEFGPPVVVAGRGKPGGIPAVPLVGLSEHDHERGRTPFAGRRSELEMVVATCARSFRERVPLLVTVVAEPGLGKSRLAREAWERLARAEPGARLATGRCAPSGSAGAYAPFADILRDRHGLLESDPGDVVLERLGGDAVLAMTVGLPAPEGLHPLVARDRLHGAWVRTLEEMAAEAPTLLLVEDVHWADEEALVLLERIVDDARVPLAVVVTTRPEFVDRRPRWLRRSAATLWLEPLAREDAETMLGALLPDPDAVSALADRAEGNPFFLEELAAAVHGGVAGADIPDSVHAVLASRIDMLPPPEKAALQAAAVIGRTFWSGPLYDLLDGGVPDLRLLEERQFIVRRGTSSLAGEDEYAFQHALTRDVAYGMLPRGRRARFHAAFAEGVEERYGGRDEDAAVLAHHYALAADPEVADLAWGDDPERGRELVRRAVRWLGRSAELATGRYALDEALTDLGRALALDPDTATRAHLWHRIGQAHALNYDGERFSEAIARAIELAAPEAHADLYAELAYETTASRQGMWKRRPDPELVNGWVARALELTTATPDSPARVKALAAAACNDPAGAAAAAEEAIAIAERSGEPGLLSDALHPAVEAAIENQEVERAFELAQRRLGLSDHFRDVDRRSDTRWSFVVAALSVPRFADAERAAIDHEQLVQELSPHHRVHGVGLLQMLAEARGDWGRALELEELTRTRTADNADTPCAMSSRSLLVCALAASCLGDRARRDRLVAAAEETGMEGYGLTIDEPRLRMAIVEGDLDEVERLVEAPKAFAFAHTAAAAARLDGLAALGRGDEVEELAATATGYLEPFALRALGRVRRDRELVARAEARFREWGMDWYAEETRASDV